jgi:hypothetical protein
MAKSHKVEEAVSTLTRAEMDAQVDAIAGGVARYVVDVMRELASRGVAPFDEYTPPKLDAALLDCVRAVMRREIDALEQRQAKLDTAPAPTMELRVDEARYAAFVREGRGTGIFVRARLDASWGSYDLSTLERESLITWLRSADELAESTVLRLLGHHVLDGEKA